MKTRIVDLELENDARESSDEEELLISYLLPDVSDDDDSPVKFLTFIPSENSLVAGDLSARASLLSKVIQQHYLSDNW